jgi:uncharacterized membrane protein YphA (DoxX/SURF4 family)
LTARVGLALTYVTSGIRKLPGIHFTRIPPENPVGAFFDVMYEIPIYWNTIGYLQIVLGCLLLFNRTVVAASLMILPVTVNIMLISFALHMKGTPIVTTMMFLGNILLLIWHFENYSGILKRPMK